MSTTDLLGDEPPKPLPAGKRLRDFDELIGHTILATFEGSQTKRDVDLVIVTATKCWITARAENDGDGAFIHVEWKDLGNRAELDEYVSAQKLFHAGCINHGEYEALLKVEADKEEVKRQRERNMLLNRLAELDKRAGASK